MGLGVGLFRGGVSLVSLEGLMKNSRNEMTF